MDILLPKIDGIYDIQPPLAAELSNTEWFLIFFIISILFGMFFYFLWKIIYSKRNRIKRKIIQLQKSSSVNTTTPHDTVYLLSDYIRQGIGLTCLTQQTALPDQINSQQTRWSDFTKKLDQLRYQKEYTSDKELNTLFTESLYWLRNWP